MKRNRRSIRLKGYNYSQPGYYFVTICTKNSISYFGEIIDNKIQLSQIGNAVINEWNKTEELRNNIKLDLFTVMPNHFHGILIIENINIVGAYCNTPLQQSNTPTQSNISLQPPSQNLGSTIRGFKSSVKRWCNKNGYKNFEWQRNYYERIIRNEFELYKIRKYIINNPFKWHVN